MAIGLKTSFEKLLSLLPQVTSSRSASSESWTSSVFADGGYISTKPKKSTRGACTSSSECGMAGESEAKSEQNHAVESAGSVP